MNVIVFQYEEGVLANITSAVSTNTGRDAIIVGDKGKIVIPNFWTAESVQLYDNKGGLIDTYTFPFPSDNGYIYEAEEVNKCIREGKQESEIMPLKDSPSILNIMDDIRSKWGLTYPQEQGK